MKILADESVDNGIVTRLREDGHDVKYVAEMSPKLAKTLIPAFLGAEYQGNKPDGERLARRVEKIHKLENGS